MKPIISETGYCRRWGSRPFARIVYGLTPEEKAFIQLGGAVLIEDCPPATNGAVGTTYRRVVFYKNAFYSRVPSDDMLAQLT